MELVPRGTRPNAGSRRGLPARALERAVEPALAVGWAADAESRSRAQRQTIRIEFVTFQLAPAGAGQNPASGSR